MNVIIEPQIVDNPADYNSTEIIGQKPEAGTSVSQGGTITLYVPDIDDLYPDFTTGDYSLLEIQQFAKKYNLNLQIKYIETEEYEPGTIFAQSREAKTKIVAGATFTISIAQEVMDPVVEVPDE